MNGQEMKEALLNGKAIVYNDINMGEIKYKCIHEIVVYNDNGVLKSSAVLLDFSGMSATRASPDRIRYAREY